MEAQKTLLRHFTLWESYSFRLPKEFAYIREVTAAIQSGLSSLVFGRSGSLLLVITALRGPLMDKLPIITATNITPPRLGKHILRRNRIVHLFNENLDKRLILVCAGAGYGKTTVLSEYVAQSKTSVAWYHIESSHGSLLPFILHLAEAIKRAQPHFGAQIPQLADFARSFHTQYEAIIATLINELVENTRDHLSIVLDNLEVVGNNKTLMKAIDYLVLHLPANVTLIICTRILPPLSLSRLEARSAMFTIGEKELRFNREEIISLFGGLFKRSLGHREIEEFERYIEGWITGLIIFGKLRLPDRASWDHETLFTFFSEEIFEKQSRSVQRFLLESAAFDPISVEICDAVFYRKDSQEQLCLLESNHLFTARQDEEAEWFRFHPLFRDFLRKKAHGVDWYSWKESYCRIGEYFETRQERQIAIANYLIAEEYNRAAQLIQSLDVDSVLAANGRVWIDNLPEEVLHQYPAIYCLKANIAISYHQYDLALSDLQTALDLVKRSEDRSQIASIKQLLGRTHFRLGQLAEATSCIEEALEGSLSDADRLEALNTLGECYKYKGDHERAILIFKESQIIAQEIGNTAKEFILVMKLESMTGDPRYIPDCDAQQFDTINTKMKFYEFYGHLYLKRGEFSKALDSFDSLRQLLRKYRLPEMHLTELGMGFVMLYQLRLKEAKRHFGKALILSRRAKDYHIVEWAIAMMIETAFYAGRIRETKELIRQHLPNLTHKETQLVVQFIQARIAIQERKQSLAEAWLTDAAKLCAEITDYPSEIMIHLIQAKYALAFEHITKAKDSLRKAFEVVQKDGYPGAMLREYLWDPELFEFARQSGICGEYLDFLETKALENSIMIEVNYLGPLRFNVEGEGIDHDAWKSGRSRAVLAYFALWPKRKYTREKLIELFWEDAESLSSTRNFHPTLSYIKTALNSSTQDRLRKIEPIIHEGGLYSLNPELRFKTDIAEFQLLVEEAKRCEGSDISQAIARYEKAISLYQGDFMEEFYYRWTEEQRAYHRSRFYEVLKTLAKLHAAKRDWPKALEYLTRARVIDELDEEVHQEIIECYLQLGMRGTALEHFHDMEQLFQEKLGTKPSQAVRVLLQTLSRKKSTDSGA